MSAVTKDWNELAFCQLDEICAELGGRSNDLLSVMYSESGARASALNDNPKFRRNTATGALEPVPLDERYNAAGGIQCMPFILKNLGFRPELGPRARAQAFCALTINQQMPYIRRYFLPYKGKLLNVSAWYLATFLPAKLDRAGEPEYVLAAKADAGFSGAVYRANAAFDADGDLKIQVRELGQAVLRNCVGPRWAELATRLAGNIPIPAATVPPPTRVDLGTWHGVQTVLAELGYDTGKVDGVLGPKTHAAIEAFQWKSSSLVADGIYGPRTRAALQAAHEAFLAGHNPPG